MDYSIEKIRAIVEKCNGIASAERLMNEGITRIMIYAALAEGILRKESHGNYCMADNQPDEYCLIQCRSEKIVFSHATALFLHGMSDRIPHVLDVTVPQGDNISKIKRDHTDTRFHYCKKELWNLGLSQIVTPQGYKVNAYDKERCICDLIKDKSKIDSQVYAQGIRDYFANHCDSRKIISYSKQLKVEEMVRTYMEVLTF